MKQKLNAASATALLREAFVWYEARCMQKAA
jgi:hypothetical protein